MFLKNVTIRDRANELINLGIKENKISKDYTKDVELDFNGAVAIPGLINSHDHLEFNLYPKLGNKIYNDYVEWGDDIHNKNKDIIAMTEMVPYELRFKWGLYKNLLCGITTVAHHGKGKIIKFEGMPDIITNYNYLHSIQLEPNWKLKLNLLFNSKPFVIHIGEGINNKSSEEINELLKWNLINRKIIGVHGISLDGKRSRGFNAIVWCPDSNIFLYNNTADISELKKNTEILFGSDSTLSSDWNIWNHLRLARKLGYLNDNELYERLSNKAAKVWGINSVGSLSENKEADIVVSKKNLSNYWDNFYSTNPEDILMILKSGRIVFLDKQYSHSLIELNGFDLIEINGVQKYIVRGIKGLMQNIRTYIPGYKFPIKVI